jgi:hypothetical protein
MTEIDAFRKENNRVLLEASIGVFIFSITCILLGLLSEMCSYDMVLHVLENYGFVWNQTWLVKRKLVVESNSKAGIS